MNTQILIKFLRNFNSKFQIYTIPFFAKFYCIDYKTAKKFIEIAVSEGLLVRNGKQYIVSKDAKLWLPALRHNKRYLARFRRYYCSHNSWCADPIDIWNHLVCEKNDPISKKKRTTNINNKTESIHERDTSDVLHFIFLPLSETLKIPASQLISLFRKLIEVRKYKVVNEVAYLRKMVDDVLNRPYLLGIYKNWISQANTKLTEDVKFFFDKVKPLNNCRNRKRYIIGAVVNLVLAPKKIFKLREAITGFKNRVKAQEYSEKFFRERDEMKIKAARMRKKFSEYWSELTDAVKEELKLEARNEIISETGNIMFATDAFVMRRLQAKYGN